MARAAWNTQRANNLLDGATPYYRLYATADGKHVAVGAIEPKFYAELIKVTGLQGQIDPAKQNDRSTWPETIRLFAERFAQRTRDAWGADAEKVDACLSPVLDFLEAAAHPHNQANALYKQQPFAQPDRIVQFDR